VSVDYVAKSGKERRLSIADDDVLEVIAALKRRRGGGDELLAWREHGTWRDIASADLNTYVKDVVAPDASARDFRTWHGTVLAALALSAVPVPSFPTAARRAALVVLSLTEGRGGVRRRLPSRPRERPDRPAAARRGPRGRPGSGPSS
jgi:DNA topoisomerase IB